jgi:hypothetical protein
MTRPPCNPRRAYDADGNDIRPMSLGNMREHGGVRRNVSAALKAISPICSIFGRR